MQAEIWEQCAGLNTKKAALDEKVKASTNTARLESLKQELRDLEEKVRATKELIEHEKDTLAASGHEVQALSAELKDDIDILHGLGRQLVGGDDREDELVIAEANRTRLEASATI